MLKEVPRISLVEALHAKDVIWLFAIDDELKGYWGVTARGKRMQVFCFWDSHDHRVWACAINAGHAIVRLSNIFNLGNKPLSVNCLDALWPYGIRVLTEWAIGFLSEEPWPFVPHKGSCLLTFGIHNLAPEFIELRVSILLVVCSALEVAFLVNWCSNLPTFFLSLRACLG